MAISILDERIVVNECDAITGWVGSTTVSLFTAEPTPIESTGCLGMVVSATTQNAYIAVTSVDLSGGQLIYVWIFHRAELDSRANGGLMIQLGDGTNRIGFHVAGNDVDGFRHQDGPVGWQCIVLDTGNLPSAFTTFAGARASLNLNAITQIGVGFKTLVKAVGGVANCFWDIIRRAEPGKGIVVTGGSSADPADFEEIAQADRQIGNLQALGVFRKLGAGLYGCQGTLKIGSNTGGATFFQDDDVVVSFEDRGVSTGKYVFQIQGNPLATTNFQLGVQVGSGDTLNGRDNCSIVCPSTQSARFIATGSGIQTMKLFATQLTNIKEGAYFSTASEAPTGHMLGGCSISHSSQLDFGRVMVRNTTISNYSGSTAAVLWGTGANIRYVNFIAGPTGGAIQHNTTTGSPFTYYSLSFAGYGTDNTSGAAILNTSSGAINISIIDGDIPSYRNSTGSSTTITASYSLTLEDLITGSEVRAYLGSPPSDTQIAGIESSSTSFEFSHSVPNQAGYIIVHSLGYVPLQINLTYSPSNQSIPVSQQIDRVYENL